MSPESIADNALKLYHDGLPLRDAIAEAVHQGSPKPQYMNVSPLGDTFSTLDEAVESAKKDVLSGAFKKVAIVQVLRWVFPACEVVVQNVAD